MPRYELALILKAMQRPEAAAALRRTVETLLERGAVVRDLENLGERRLPYKISKHNQRHTHGGYYLIDFHASPSAVRGFLNHLERDVDVIRPTVLKKDAEGSQGSQAQCCGPSPAQTNKRPST
ncbi:28S ribosomal protein S6, mitochondrial [Colossoma macropomum]|uniref:28S ribosomal protein S6, mitochondrial n=1 Tax=Colossoma macropomum TaxID=42526 RepID=UPI0018652AD7|nr:28S ribosomal protein S6, mitochondrial [Colossoma macropomum]